MKVSIITPCYNAATYIQATIQSIQQQTLTDWELLVVDDGSTDNSPNILKEYSKKDKKVRFVSFSRNFGKEAGMFAGLEATNGDYVAIMDADMQDPPFLLPKMMEIIKTGEYDSVATRRETRKGEPKLRSFFAKSF